MNGVLCRAKELLMKADGRFRLFFQTLDGIFLEVQPDIRTLYLRIKVMSLRLRFDVEFYKYDFFTIID